MFNLHTLKANKGVTKNRKRVGRGNASGHGTYSGRGLKGQKARSGVSGLKRLGLKSTLFSMPKKRGFKSLSSKDQVVSSEKIEKNFKEGDKVNPIELFKKGLIGSSKKPVKILAKGELKLKKLEFSGVKMSNSVKNNLIAKN